MLFYELSIYGHCLFVLSISKSSLYTELFVYYWFTNAFTDLYKDFGYAII